LATPLEEEGEGDDELVSIADNEVDK